MQHAAEMVAFISERARGHPAATAKQRGNAVEEGGHVVLIAQNFTAVRIRIGVYSHAFANQMQFRSGGTRSAGGKPGSRDSEAFLKIYTLGSYDIQDERRLKKLCIILLALGVTHQERRKS